MSTIRVSICGMPKLLGSIVTGILDADPEIEITEVDIGDALDWPEDTHVLLVTDEMMSKFASLGPAWKSGTRLGIVALSSDCNHAHVIRLVTQYWSIEQAGKITLSNAIRFAAGTNS